MSLHILLDSVPRHEKGSVIEIPDDEISIMLKGKGYYCQIYKESSILADKVPDYAFKPTNEDYFDLQLRTGRDMMYTQWKNIYKAYSHYESEKLNVPYGSYGRINSHGSNEVFTYTDLESQGYNFIDKTIESKIVAGDIVYRIYGTGKKIACLATTNENFISTGTEFNRVMFLENVKEYGIVTGQAYASGRNGPFFYEKIPKDHLTDNLNNTIQLIVGRMEPDLVFDSNQMKIVKS